jgi:hypothetical protein
MAARLEAAPFQNSSASRILLPSARRIDFRAASNSNFGLDSFFLNRSVPKFHGWDGHHKDL